MNLPEPGPNLTSILVTLLTVLGSWLGISRYRAYRARNSDRPDKSSQDKGGKGTA